MNKFKVTLSVIVGAVFMIVPLYQVVMYGLHLSEKINYTFISFCFGVSLIAFWGRLKVLAKSIQESFTKTQTPQRFSKTVDPDRETPDERG
jgi:hypothetical protein